MKSVTIWLLCALLGGASSFSFVSASAAEHTTTQTTNTSSTTHPKALRREAAEVRDIIHRVNDRWQAENPAEVRSFWDNAAYHTGNMEAYALTGEARWLDYSLRWAEHNEWKGAKERDRSRWKYTYGEKDDYVLFGDYQICFQTYVDLYHILPDERRIARAKEVMEYEMSTPQHDYWWWSDGLYMVMPVMTKLYRVTGNPQYLEKLYEYLSYADSIMLDDETGLYYRDAKYVYPEHKSVNGRKDFWARGDGWVLAGLAKVLRDLPADDRHRNFYVEKFRRMAASVANLQQPEGYWTRSMMDPDHAPGAETSGTAFFTYGILWGVNHGLLDAAQYRPVIERAWHYLRYTALQKNGAIGYVQPIGERAIPGQVVDAHSETNFGVGAFLLAACEYVRYLEAAAGSDDRAYWSDLLYRMAAPVLRNMAAGELHAQMTVELSPTWDGRNQGVVYMETFGRLMAGVAPWLNLPDDDTPETARRRELREWARCSYAHAVDPDSPDYLLWRREGQTLVDAAYLAESFIRGYDSLWVPLSETTKARYIDEFSRLRRVDPPYTNWLLFSATIESFLLRVGADGDLYRVHSAIRKVEEWYVGDGWYSDGPEFAFDYYSSYVFHPMYLETLQNMMRTGRHTRIDYAAYYRRALRRAQRHSALLERMISPEGTFPVFGRSIPYRMAALQPLALTAWQNTLPVGVTPGQARAALTAVMHRMFDGAENFTNDGYLTIGFVGRQTDIADWYTNNGSLYMTSLAFLPLGLPATDPFWSDAAQPCTQAKAWGGQSFPKDHVWRDEIRTRDLY
jgi:rhamnogalacturonyl hydrolase YesR